MMKDVLKKDIQCSADEYGTMTASVPWLVLRKVVAVEITRLTDVMNSTDTSDSARSSAHWRKNALREFVTLPDRLRAVSVKKGYPQSNLTDSEREELNEAINRETNNV